MSDASFMACEADCLDSEISFALCSLVWNRGLWTTGTTDGPHSVFLIGSSTLSGGCNQ